MFITGLFYIDAVSAVAYLGLMEAHKKATESRGAIFIAMFRYTVRLFGMVRHETPWLLVMMAALTLGDALLPLGRGKVQEWLIDALTASLGTGVISGAVIWSFIALAIALILGGLFWLPLNYVRTMVFEHVRARTDIVLRSAMARLDVAHYEDPSFMDTVEKANTEGMRRIQSFLDQQLQVIFELVTVIGAGLAIGLEQWWILIGLVIVTIPELMVRSHFARKVWDLRTRQAEVQRRLGVDRRLFGTAATVIELKLGALISYFLGRIERTNGELIKNEQEYMTSWTWASVLSGLVAYTGIIAAALYFLFATVDGTITIGRLVFLLSMIVMFRSSLGRFFRMLSSNYEHTLFMHDVFALIDATPRVPVSEHPQALTTRDAPTIVFDRVSFAYPGTDTLILKDVSFTITSGEKVALVGINGAGKTTLIKLLCRFYDPTEGRITIDGIDLRELDLASWYARLGILFQDYTSYKAMTLREAIEVGDITRPRDDRYLSEALRKAEADVFVDAFPHRYEQVLGKNFTKGTEVSGGQWQKLALARVFYRDPQVWVLDEPTSAIDAESEAHIFDRIEQTLVGRTAIIISHRFSTVRNAHRIFVLKDGVIAEQGNHATLMALDGDYARLFSLQAKRYDRDAAAV